jgi:hypothetical protein
VVMTARPGSLVLAIAVTVAFGLTGLGVAQEHAKEERPRSVSVYVDSVLAADTNEGMDARLAPLGKKLQGLFSFTTYSLVSHQDGQTECGKMIAFMLPGGKILHIQPRAIDGDMIAMEIVLFDGTRPMMTTDLKLKNKGTLIVGGPRYDRGMLIISIGASTEPHARSTPAQALAR